MSGFEISADLYRSLRANVANVVSSVREAEGVVQQHLHDAVQQRAASDPRWIGLADYIDTWDDDGTLWVGVREPAFVSEAFAAEYGTSGYPPAPILRTLDSETRRAAAKAAVHLSSRLGTNYH
jgi:hypothetical protein